MDWKYDLCHKAAEYGRLELLRWAYEAKIYVWKNDVRVCQYAIGSGNLDLYHWAVENGLYWSLKCPHFMTSAAITAAEKGQLEVLKWVVEQCPSGADALRRDFRDSRCCSAAAEFGHFEVLQWLRSINSAWDENTFYNAIIGDNINIVQHMYDNDIAAQNGR